MALAITGTPDVQTRTNAAGGWTATHTSTSFGAGEIIVIEVTTQGDTNRPTIGTPSGGGLTWTQAVTVNGTDPVQTSVYWAHNSGAQTFSPTFTVTNNGGSISARSVMKRFTGADTTTPIGTTDTYNSGTADPTFANNGLQIASVASGSIVNVIGLDWDATAVGASTCAFDNSLTDTHDLGTQGSNESGVATYYSFRSGTTSSGSLTVEAEIDVTGNGSWGLCFYEVKAASTDTNANAGNAAGTGAANAATTSIKPSAEHSSATGAANAPTASIKPSAENAAATGAANAPTVDVKVNAGHASATGAAYQPTVSTGGDTNANAGHASATGAATDPSVSIKPSAEHSSATGAANAPTVSVSPSAGHSSATGAANDPTSSVKPSAEHASATGQAFDATVWLSVSTAVAAATGAAQAPTAAVYANAGHASATGSAYGATGPSSTDTTPLTMTVRDRGHMATVKGEGHTVTIRTRSHTSTARENR